MPSRINGIGTWYLGKTNAESYAGFCARCNRDATLERYETRLWFTFLYIPLIPLQRKQILDHCPLCTSHNAIPIEQWEGIRERAIDEGMEELAADQNDPEAAIKLLGTLSAFHQNNEAEQLARALRTKFPNDVEVQLNLGAWHEQARDHETADACFRRAFELDPDHPFCIRAEGLGRIERGDLDGANELISKLAPPSDQFDPQVFYMLAAAYQNAGRDQDALRVFGVIIEGAPDWKNDKQFRAAVRRTEKALGLSTISIVGRQSVFDSPYIKVFAALIVVGAIIGGLFSYNSHIHNNRQLRVLNGLAKAITVKVGEKRIEVPPKNYGTLTLSEGEYRAEVVSPADFAPFDFEIKSGWFQRFTSTPAFVLDPTRSGCLIWEEAVYREQPVQGDGRQVFHLAFEYQQFDHVDYAFESFPRELTVDSGKGYLKKTRVGMEALDSLALGMIGVDIDRQMLAMESRLKADSGNEDLLRSYVTTALGAGGMRRAADFLKSRIDERPLSIDWHRYHQRLAESNGESDELIAYYDKALEQGSDEPGLLYLRGRLEPLAAKAIGFYERALAIDSSHSHTSAAMAFVLRSAGRFDEAWDALETALKSRPDHPQLTDMRLDLQMARKSYDEIRAEAEEARGDDPNAMHGHQGVMKALAAQGEFELLRKERAKHDSFQSTFLQRMQLQPSGDLQAAIQGALMDSGNLASYCEGDYDSILKTTSQQPNHPTSVQWRIAAALEAGQFDIVEQVLKSSSRQVRKLLLATSIEYRLQGNEKRAADLQKKWIEELPVMTNEWRLATRIIESGDAAAVDEALQITMIPQEKSLILIALAARTPKAERGKLLDLAERLNYGFDPPYHWIKTAVERLR